MRKRLLGSPFTSEPWHGGDWETGVLIPQHLFFIYRDPFQAKQKNTAYFIEKSPVHGPVHSPQSRFCSVPVSGPQSKKYIPPRT